MLALYRALVKLAVQNDGSWLDGVIEQCCNGQRRGRGSAKSMRRLQLRIRRKWRAVCHADSSGSESSQGSYAADSKSQLKKKVINSNESSKKKPLAKFPACTLECHVKFKDTGFVKTFASVRFSCFLWLSPKHIGQIGQCNFNNV